MRSTLPKLQTSIRSNSRTRCGISILELLVSMVLIGAAAATVVPLVKRVDLMKREIGRRELALQSANNLLEEFTLRDWSELTQQNADALPTEQLLGAELPEPEWAISVTELETGVPSRRVTVAVTWKNSNGVRVSPLQLSTVVSERKETP